jgi:signal transduction histidine kinase
MRYRRVVRTISSLRARVALAAAVVASLVGLGAAGAAAVLVEHFNAAAQDERLSGAAMLMQRELDLQGGDPRRHVDDEAAEIAPIGLRIALFEDGVRTSGAEDVAYAQEEGCSSRDGAEGRWRTCAVGTASRRVIVSTHRHEGMGRWPVWLAVGGAALLAAIASALASRALAGWALAPLTALGERIEKISDAAGDPDLGEPSGTEEVEVLRETIRGLLVRLGEAIERSRGFAASAAHELRTPLATMIAELDLEAEVTAPRSESLVRVRRTAGRLAVLVERLLQMTSGNANALVTEAVAIEDVVRELVAARPEADRARLDVVSRASGIVRGDETLLRIVVENLVDNALKFSPAQVEVIVEEDDDEVRLTVRDEGPGIDPSDADRLLRPFARGAQTSVPGHGLGLAIVSHAARLHGGSVRFVPRERGTELRVSLPIWTAR